MALRLKKQIPRRKKQLAALLALLLAGALLIAVSAWQNWLWFRQPAVLTPVGFPGSAIDSIGRYVAGQTDADAMQKKIDQLLSDQGGLAAWYRLAGRTGIPQAERSTVLLALDQARYGQYLLEQQDKKGFAIWWEGFRSAWRMPEGSYRGGIDLTGQDLSLADTDWLRVNLLVARLLVQSCAIWPDQDRYADLRQLSGLLLTDLTAGSPADQTAVVPTAAPVPDPGATPTPKPAVTPTPAVDAGIRLNVLRLASIDLFAMNALAQIDPAWEKLSDTYLTCILDGYLGDALPLYAWAWQPDTGGYLPFQGSQPQIDTEEAILTVLHLCEVGQIPEKSIAWIRDRLYNESALYVAYHTGQGVAADSRESLASYAMVARIARSIGDENLYDSAVRRLLWHQATSRTSAALAAIFRQEQDAIFVWASDNIWALLAVH